MAVKIIKKFNLDTSPVSIDGQTRSFSIIGDIGAVFSLEITNEDATPTYYNFDTQTFSTTRARLNFVNLSTGIYRGTIKFPKVGDADHYDITLFAEHSQNTRHAPYNEVRFPDGSIDINSSTGSNSSILRKKIYQYADSTITLSAISPNSVTEWGSVSVATDVVSGTRFGRLAKTAFTVTVTSAVTRSISINSQPTENSLTTYVERDVGDPVDIKTEDIYPAISDTDTVDGAVASGIKVVMDNNVASNLVVGDKITTAVQTDTVDGAVTSGIKVVMDNNVATKMAVGDQITGNAALDAKIVTVAALNPDTDNVKEFSMSEAIAIGDGITLTFSSKLNRSLTTVAALNPDGDNVKEFSMSQAIALVDGVTLSFSNRKNYRWEIASDSSLHGLTSGMLAIATNVTSGSRLSDYTDSTTVTTAEGTGDTLAYEESVLAREALAGGEVQTKVKNVEVLAVDPSGFQPTLTDGVVSAQLGNITFDKQQALVLADDDNIKFYGHGPSAIENLTNTGIRVSDLKVELTDVTTTTTSTVSANTSVPVASRNGIFDKLSSVSGIGIDSSSAVPTVASGAGTVSGAGTIVLSAAQTLESGITLTFKGASRIATITGDIEVTKFPETNTTVYFDLETFLKAN